MIIKILGTGCPKCKLLQQTVEDVSKELKLDCKIIKVDDMNDILQYDIMAMPGLVIDEQLVLAGQIPTPEQMKDILQGGCCGGKSDGCCSGGSCCGA